ncbi:MAG TPA: metal-dependent transcriptional regulator [Erysipelotrichaceae bacterium]|nr:metal-dependent transcriptional regulator [Erysipelotrichaceae bacterium]
MYTKKKSVEDYLERILMLKESNDEVRAIDIANSMNFSKPSVSIALKKLIARGYITVEEKTGFISLTESGLKIAQETYEKHVVLTEYFESLGVDKTIAREDACKIEHLLSDEVFNKIKEQLINKKK